MRLGILAMRLADTLSVLRDVGMGRGRPDLGVDAFGSDPVDLVLSLLKRVSLKLMIQTLMLVGGQGTH